MSGLQDYYKANNSYNSSANSMDNYVASYIAAPIDEFNSKLDSLRAQGSSLVEAGGAIEGLYAGGKGLQSSIKALRSKLNPADDAGDADAGADAGAEAESTFFTGGTELGADVGGAGGIELGTVGAGTGAAESGGLAAAGVGEAVGEGIGLAVGATVAEAIPVVGGLAAIGIGLYELFHKKKPPPPNKLTANQISMRNEVTVPSYDSVVDQPASSSVF